MSHGHQAHPDELGLLFLFAETYYIIKQTSTSMHIYI